MISPRLGLSLLAGAGALATAGTSRLARRRVETAEAAYPPVGDIIEVGGVGVHALRRGTGPDLVMLHGAGGNLREFAFDLMGRLEDRFTVTAFDRPGLGYTDMPPGTPDAAFDPEGASPQAQAALLRQASQAMGITNPIVLGHSYGGIVAMAWALAALDEESPANPAALVSLAGVIMPWTTTLGAYYRVYGSSLGGAVLAPAVAAFATEKMVDDRVLSIFDPQDMPEGYREFIGAELLLRHRSFRQNARQVNTLLPHVLDMAPRYGELALPIEFLHGRADTTVPLQVHPEAFMAHHSIGNLTVMDGVGHMPHHADPEAAVAAILRAADRANVEV